MWFDEVVHASNLAHEPLEVNTHTLERVAFVELVSFPLVAPAPAPVGVASVGAAPVAAITLVSPVAEVMWVAVEGLVV